MTAVTINIEALHRRVVEDHLRALERAVGTLGEQLRRGARIAAELRGALARIREVRQRRANEGRRQT